MTDSLDKEIAAYNQMRDDLLKHHAGKFVVIKDESLIGAYDNFNNAATEATRRFGKGPYLIRQVGGENYTIPASVIYRIIHAAT